ncbi:MAG TPA: hypothetical protein VGD81_00100 [Opitutaceae bacterium]
MKRFRYGLDPLCLAACALYAANRLLWKPHAGPGFFHGHFNDLLLIPAALPWVLGLSRRLGWRTHDAAPTAPEIAFHTVVWSVICEGLGPALTHHGTADWRDVVCYAAGGIAAWLAWNGKPARRTAVA